jgi:hypothetical protein
MQIWIAALASAALFAAMLAAQEIGRRGALRRAGRTGVGASGGTSTIDAAVFALLGLLLAFTFSGAAGRFDNRRQQIVEETNDIGTAYLRIDLLPADRQAALRDLFRQYVDSRLATYREGLDTDAGQARHRRTVGLQAELWKQAVAASQVPGVPTTAAMLMLPSLNAMFDIAAARSMAIRMHPPTVVFAMLFGLAVASALLAGYGMAGGSTRPVLHMVMFGLAMAISVYVILDIEYPRHGLIRLDAFDEALVALRSTMN